MSESKQVLSVGFVHGGEKRCATVKIAHFSGASLGTLCYHGRTSVVSSASLDEDSIGGSVGGSSVGSVDSVDVVGISVSPPFSPFPVFPPFPAPPPFAGSSGGCSSGSGVAG